MVTVWENGRLVHDWTFAEVRSRADADAPLMRVNPHAFLIDSQRRSCSAINSARF